MAQFKPAKITSQGQLMMMQDLKGEIDLQFTRIAFGNGEYTEEEYSTITARSALKSQKQSFNINSMGILSKNSLLLGVVASNESLSEGYSMTEVGLFAKDSSGVSPTERLYAIVIAENGCADYMPAYNGSSTVRIRQNFQVDVVDASTVSIEVTDSAVVSQSYLEEFYYNKTQADSAMSAMINARHPKPKHCHTNRAIGDSGVTISRNSTVNDQITNNDVGRLYISGTDFIEYADLESTEGAELTTENEPSDNYYIQTWHRADGSIWQRTKIGDNGTPSAWTEISAATAT